MATSDNNGSFVLSFSQEAVDATYARIVSNQEESGSGTPAPELAEQLTGDKKNARVVSLLVEQHLSDKVSVAKGQGGGFIANAVPLTRATGGRSRDLPEGFVEQVKDKIEYALKINPKGVTREALGFMLGTADIGSITAALAHLPQYEPAPKVGIRRAAPKLENPVADEMNA